MKRSALGLVVVAVGALAVPVPRASDTCASEYVALPAIVSERLHLFAGPGDRARPEIRSLATALDADAAEMAARLPLSLNVPVRVFLEPDHVQQAQHGGAVGAAVSGNGSGYDLYLVFHPADLDAYRFALARELMTRAGLAAPAGLRTAADGDPESGRGRPLPLGEGRGEGRSANPLPPWLVRGAALWLSRDWYGRPYEEWLPDLAAAGALPTAAELLAPEVQPDSSAPLWTPVAAAVIAALPGETLAAKLARPTTASEVEAVLARLEAAGRGSAAGAFPTQVDPAAWKGISLRGVSFAMLNSLDYGYHAPSVDRELDRLAGLGADAVSIMPFAYQPAPDRPEVRFLNRGVRSETDAGCLHAARCARAKGFRVLWKPHLWISHRSWPGEVAMTGEEDWRAWWRSYRRYILHHAFLARWAGAEILAVGVELDRTLARRREWEELIAAVRRLYPGALTYASNWYTPVESIGLWRHLDLVGVDAYFPLAASPAATPADLSAGAGQIAERLADAARRLGKPVLLTEVGFSARRAAWMEPHTEGGEYHEGDQALAYRALLTALERRPWLAGVFLWKAMSGAPAGEGGRLDPASPDFRFLGRAAEGEVRRFFGKGPG